jgi:putative transposase
MEVFHKREDYEAFLELLALAKARHGVKMFAFCVMPNHFHLVLEPSTQMALSQFMQWLLTSHVRRYHRHYHGSGHVWQGRFKSFPIQRDEHLLVLLRYVLQNPVRAGLVKSLGEWAWSSIQRADLTDPCPVDAQAEWRGVIEEPLPFNALEIVRECAIVRDRLELQGGRRR